MAGRLILRGSLVFACVDLVGGIHMSGSEVASLLQIADQSHGESEKRARTGSSRQKRSHQVTENVTDTVALLRDGCGQEFDGKQKSAARKLSRMTMDVKSIHSNGVQAPPNECGDANDGSMTLDANARLYFGTPTMIQGPIVEVGGNVGGDLEVFTDQYNRSPIFSYEPVPYLAKFLESHPVVHGAEGRVRIVQAAVGSEAGSITLFGGPGMEENQNFMKSIKRKFRNEEASQFAEMGVQEGGDQWTVPKVDVDEALYRVRDETRQDPVALSINCEGCEYELMTRLLETEWLGKLRFIQLSWHLPSIENRLEKHCLISSKLREAGYHRVYKSYFGWEGWALPCNEGLF